MENLDVYILSSVVATLFIVFILGIIRAVRDVDGNSDKFEKEGGPRVAMLKFVGKLFDDEKIPKKEKKTIFIAMNTIMSDMESDGVYFPKEVKDEIEKQKDVLI